ncbi:MAG: BCD family MFS transporter [Proteobacteria bacterium]|nr:BCD family MFS transporter [Pseudomonadota bacterium]
MNGNGNARGKLGWLGIVRLGLVQMALGSVVVLTTSTLNRVMVVELALPAMLPGALVGLHYALQVFRPRLGHGSDIGGRRTPWIVGGMALLCAGGALAAVATAWMASSLVAGIALAIAAFVMIGIGVGAAGTSLLVLLAQRTDERRRGAAATIVWVMMIVGFILTAIVTGKLLDPFSTARLVEVAGLLAVVAFAVSLFAVWGMEERGGAAAVAAPAPEDESGSFREALREVWHEPHTRRFAVFVFLSMIAYSAQDLILEPFAGLVFGLTPGQTTQLSGVQNGGVLTGMLIVAAFSSGVGVPRLGSLRAWTIGGCLASALALVGLAVAGASGPPWPIKVSVFALGLANGVYAIAAIGSMMTLVGQGKSRREGVRMGLWGAAQAIAFGAGGLLGTLASDLARLVLGNAVAAYGVVFCIEAVLFVVAALLALRAAGALGGEAGGREARLGGIAAPAPMQGSAD